MKGDLIAVSIFGPIAGFILGAIVVAVTVKDPEKRIEWRPADRYEMALAADGNVWRLDKATGTIHVVCGNASFDIPEYRGYETK